METSCKLTQFLNQAIFYRPRKLRQESIDCSCKSTPIQKGTSSGLISESVTLARAASIRSRSWTSPNLVWLVALATEKMSSSNALCSNQISAAIKSGNQLVRVILNSSRQKFKEERKTFWLPELIQTRTKRWKSFLEMKQAKDPATRDKTLAERLQWEWIPEPTLL